MRPLNRAIPLREGLASVRPLRLVSLVSTAPPGPTDAALVEAARAGDERACESLFRRHHRRAAGLAFRLLGRDDDVEDIVQDAFVEALDCLSGLKEPHAFASWLCSIVVSRVAKRVRRRRLFARLARTSTSPADMSGALSRSCPPEVASELQGVYRIIEELSESARMALLLRRVEGLTNEEVAECMKVSVATVKRRLAEAEERLCHFRGVGR